MKIRLASKIVASGLVALVLAACNGSPITNTSCLTSYVKSDLIHQMQPADLRGTELVELNEQAPVEYAITNNYLQAFQWQPKSDTTLAQIKVSGINAPKTASVYSAINIEDGTGGHAIFSGLTCMTQASSELIMPVGLEFKAGQTYFVRFNFAVVGDGPQKKVGASRESLALRPWNYAQANKMGISPANPVLPVSLKADRVAVVQNVDLPENVATNYSLKIELNVRASN